MLQTGWYLAELGFDVLPGGSLGPPLCLVLAFVTASMGSPRDRATQTSLRLARPFRPGPLVLGQQLRGGRAYMGRDFLRVMR